MSIRRLDDNSSERHLISDPNMASSSASGVGSSNHGSPGEHTGESLNNVVPPADTWDAVGATVLAQWPSRRKLRRALDAALEQQQSSLLESIKEKSKHNNNSIDDVRAFYEHLKALLIASQNDAKNHRQQKPPKRCTICNRVPADVSCESCSWRACQSCVRPAMNYDAIATALPYSCAYCELEAHNNNSSSTSSATTPTVAAASTGLNSNANSSETDHATPRRRPSRRQAASAVAQMDKLLENFGRGSSFHRRRRKKKQPNTNITEKNSESKHAEEDKKKKDESKDKDNNDHEKKEPPEEKKVARESTPEKRRKRKLELYNLSDALSPPVSSSTDAASTSGRGKRARRKVELYKPQDGPARDWQSSDATGKPTRKKKKNDGESSSDENNNDDESESSSSSSSSDDDDDSNGDSKSAEDAPRCDFCQDNENIRLCCFCGCRACFGKLKKKNRSAPQVTCDTCQQWYHTACLAVAPPRSSSKAWTCPACDIPAETATVVKRGPGRPRKNPIVKPTSTRKRGRPPKVDTAAAAAPAPQASNTIPASKRVEEQPPPTTTTSRSGRTVKRSVFHDEIEEGAQHLKTTTTTASTSASKRAKTVASMTATKQHQPRSPGRPAAVRPTAVPQPKADPKAAPPPPPLTAATTPATQQTKVAAAAAAPSSTTTTTTNPSQVTVATGVLPTATPKQSLPSLPTSVKVVPPMPPASTTAVATASSSTTKTQPVPVGTQPPTLPASTTPAGNASGATPVKPVASSIPTVSTAGAVATPSAAASTTSSSTTTPAAPRPVTTPATSGSAALTSQEKVPRRKPGARECVQISRRFGVRVIPETYMEILTDYCQRGKVEHLIRMRERLDDHSRFLESQLATLESLVKEKGESNVVVPAIPAGPDRKLERTMGLEPPE